MLPDPRYLVVKSGVTSEIDLANIKELVSLLVKERNGTIDGMDEKALGIRAFHYEYFTFLS